MAWSLTSHRKKRSARYSAALVLIEQGAPVQLDVRRSSAIARVLLAAFVFAFSIGLVWNGNAAGWLGVLVGAGLLWMFGAEFTGHAPFVAFAPEHLVIKHHLTAPTTLSRRDVREFALDRGARANTVVVRLRSGHAVRLSPHPVSAHLRELPVPLIDGISSGEMLELLQYWLKRHS